MVRTQVPKHPLFLAQLVSFCENLGEIFNFQSAPPGKQKCQMGPQGLDQNIKAVAQLLKRLINAKHVIWFYPK